MTATSVGALFNQFGIAVGFYMSPAIGDLNWIMVTQATLAGGVFILVALFFKSRPPTPPSASAVSTFRGFQLIQSIRLLSRNLHFMLLLLGFGMIVGVFYCLSTLLGALMDDLHYSETHIGVMGTVLVLAGMLGAIFCGYIADKFDRKHKHILLLFMCGAFFSMSWYTFSATQDNYVSLLGAFACLGFFLTALMPVSMDLAVEVAYPVPDTLGPTLLLMSAQVFGIIFIFSLQDFHNGRDTVRDSNYIMTGGVAISALLLLFFKPSYNRINSEALDPHTNDDGHEPIGTSSTPEFLPTRIAPAIETTSLI